MLFPRLPPTKFIEHEKGFSNVLIRIVAILQEVGKNPTRKLQDMKDPKTGMKQWTFVAWYVIDFF